VDLTVEEGERLLVVGSNGSGKTTLLRTLATAINPSGGELRLFGLDAAKERSAVRRRLALLSDRAGLYEDLSAADNLQVLARFTGVDPTHDVRSMLERVGLDNRPEPIRTFSSGMRKRLFLAALILQQPELVLLDEPFSALDAAGLEQVSSLIRELKGTVVIASHQLAMAAPLCDRALLMEHGLPRWTGPIQQMDAAWQALQATMQREVAT